MIEGKGLASQQARCISGKPQWDARHRAPFWDSCPSIHALQTRTVEILILHGLPVGLLYSMYSFAYESDTTPCVLELRYNAAISSKTV
mmetsp:Transcript_14020/g.50993  ORF Transcript_14020/g.50993 Transcript_14020/m.50993 type:complete len:88 (-) Transcript_14020:415-678(-)|eukprot:scaffold888_cov569-Prasinococcus_capsulatus_cf.AAC.21